MGNLILPQSAAINWGNPVNRASPLNRGLVSWWLGRGPTVGSGTWFDLLRTNNGALTNSPQWYSSVGRSGGRYSINLASASSQYVDCGTSATMDVTSTGTLAGWIHPLSTANAVYFCKGNIYNDRNGYGIYTYSGVSYGELADGTGGQQVTATQPTANAWNHYALTWNGTTLAIYRNGVLGNSAAQTKTPSPSGLAFRIGASAGTSPTYINGYEDDVRLWGRCLSADEVYQVYADSLTGYQRTLNRLTRIIPASVAAAGPVIPVFMNQYRQRVA